MLNISKQDQAVYLLYSGRTFSTGLAVTANVYDGSNNLLAGSPFSLTEIGATGMYGVSFTPTTAGFYKVAVLEGTTKMSSASIKITDYDIESVGEDVATALELLQNATYGLNALHTDLQSGVLSLESHLSTQDSNLTSGVLSLDTHISEVESKIDTLSSNVGGYVA